MADVTFKVLEGMERGQVYSDLSTPVTIGREDDNRIQLNDERISRFHVKIQDDGGHVILTDLDSTNGTRVNGHPVQIRELQIGDLVMVGRCILLYGSADEIEARAKGLRNTSAGSRYDEPTTPLSPIIFSADVEDEADGEDFPLFPEGPPVGPEGLSLAQQAQISDAFAYLHEQVREVIGEAQSENPASDAAEPFLLAWEQWQRLLNLEKNLADYLRQIVEPSQ